MATATTSLHLPEYIPLRTAAKLTGFTAPVLQEMIVGGKILAINLNGEIVVSKALGQLNVGRAEGVFALGNSQMATESPIGSPTAVSPRLVTLAELFARREDLRAERRRAKKEIQTTISQMSLF